MSRLTISRRNFLAVGGAALATPWIGGRTAWAQGKQLYVITYMGTVGTYIADTVIPEFQKKFGCTVFQKQNNTLPNISTLRSERSNPTTSVVMIDDLAVPIAKQENLLQPLPTDKIPNLAKLHEGYTYGDNYGAAVLISKVAPWYNTASLEPAPTSWADLWDERLRGRFLMVTPKWTQNVMLVAMAASLKTGKPVADAQYEMLNVAEKLTELRPNVQAIHENVGSAVLQVAQGQADIGGPDFAKNIYPYVNSGAPINVLNPKEGSFAGVNAIGLVNNAPEPELGAAFIDYLLSPEHQKGLAEMSYAAPAVRDVALSEEAAKFMPTDPAEIAKLLKLDWAWINPRRNQIIDLVNQTFG